MFRTKEIIGVTEPVLQEHGRELNDYGDRGGDDPKIAFDAWFEMIKIRYTKHLFKMNINNHPKYILNKIKDLNSSQFGFSAFGLKDNIKLNYFEYPKELKKKYF